MADLQDENSRLILTSCSDSKQPINSVWQAQRGACLGKRPVGAAVGPLRTGRVAAVLSAVAWGVFLLHGTVHLKW